MARFSYDDDDNHDDGDDIDDGYRNRDISIVITDFAIADDVDGLVAGFSYDDDHNHDDDHDDGDDIDDGYSYRHITTVITDFAIADDVDGLVNLVQRHWEDGIAVPKDLFLKVIVYGAVKSAKALLRGEGGLKFDPNVPFWNGTFFLHHAATMYSISLIKLLIRHGARTDVVTDGVNLIYNGMLPLNAALDNLRFHDYMLYWTSKDSTFKLIAILCLPQMKVPLEAIRLLARHTKETKDEFYLYVKDGHPIQIAVLLMVARDIVLAPFPSQSDDGSNLDVIMSIRKCIEEEIASLVIGKGRNSEPVWMLKDKKAGLHSALKLLDVFEKAGDAIDDYLKTKPSDMLSKDKVLEDVKSILLKVGFKLREKDIDMGNIRWETYDGWSDGDLSSKDFARTAFQSQSLQGNVPRKIDRCEQKWAVKSFFPYWTPTLSCKINYISPDFRIPMSKTWFVNPKTMGTELKVKTKATSKRTKASTPIPSSRHYTKESIQLVSQLPSIKHLASMKHKLRKFIKRL